MQLKLITILIHFSSVFCLAQTTTVPNQERYKLIASAEYNNSLEPNSYISNQSLTDLQSVVYRKTLQNTFRNIIQKQTVTNIIFDLTVLDLRFCTNNSLNQQVCTSSISSPFAMSANEQYYYYFQNIWTVTGNIIEVTLTLNNGLLTSSVFYIFNILEYVGGFGIAVNNNGTAVFSVLKASPGGEDVFVIDKFGNSKKIESAPYVFIINNIAINDLDTVFVSKYDSANTTTSIFAYPKNIQYQPKFVANYSGSTNSNLFASNRITADHTEGIVYYTPNYKKILNSANEVIMDLDSYAYPQNQFEILELKMNNNGDFIWRGRNNSQIYLIKNNFKEIFIKSGDLLNGAVVYDFYSLKTNINGDFSFVLGVLNSPKAYLYWYQAKPSKKYKLKKTISLVKNNNLIPIDNSDLFQMIPTIDTRGTQCKQKYESSKIRIKIECQNDDDLSYNIQGCKIQMQKELGNFSGGHFQPSHNLANRPVGFFTPQEIEVQFYDIPTGGLSFDYEAPQHAGEIDLNFIAAGPDNKIFEVAKSVVQVKIDGLVSLAGVPYLTMQNTGHLSEDETEEGGVYGTASFKNKLRDALALYYKECLEAGIPEEQIIRLNSEAASLVWGGLYDINFDWQPSHCGHRVGNSLDIGMANFKSSTSPYVIKMREVLEQSLRDMKLRFPIPSESPSGEKHWHTQLN